MGLGALGRTLPRKIPRGTNSPPPTQGGVRYPYPGSFFVRRKSRNVEGVGIVIILAYSFYRRKLTQKLVETEEALSSATQKASNAEKAKNRLNSELEDALIDLEKVS